MVALHDGQRALTLERVERPRPAAQLVTARRSGPARTTGIVARRSSWRARRNRPPWDWGTRTVCTVTGGIIRCCAFGLA